MRGVCLHEASMFLAAIGAADAGHPHLLSLTYLHLQVTLTCICACVQKLPPVQTRLDAARAKAEAVVTQQELSGVSKAREINKIRACACWRGCQEGQAMDVSDLFVTVQTRLDAARAKAAAVETQQELSGVSKAQEINKIYARAHAGGGAKKRKP